MLLKLHFEVFFFLMGDGLLKVQRMGTSPFHSKYYIDGFVMTILGVEEGGAFGPITWNWAKSIYIGHGPKIW